MGSRAKPQPKNDLVHIKGQNNCSRCNIFVGFADEKFQHFAVAGERPSGLWGICVFQEGPGPLGNFPGEASAGLPSSDVPVLKQAPV